MVLHRMVMADLDTHLQLQDNIMQAVEVVVVEVAFLKQEVTPPMDLMQPLFKGMQDLEVLVEEVMVLSLIMLEHRLVHQIQVEEGVAVIHIMV